MVSPMGRSHTFGVNPYISCSVSNLHLVQTSNPPSPVLSSTSYITKNVQNYGTTFQNHDLERIRGIKNKNKDSYKLMQTPLGNKKVLVASP
jgi:hypothetical protein